MVLLRPILDNHFPSLIEKDTKSSNVVLKYNMLSAFIILKNEKKKSKPPPLLAAFLLQNSRVSSMTFLEVHSKKQMGSKSCNFLMLMLMQKL